jgi:hypothetical protein
VEDGSDKHASWTARMAGWVPWENRAFDREAENEEEKWKRSVHVGARRMRHGFVDSTIMFFCLLLVPFVKGD